MLAIVVEVVLILDRVATHITLGKLIDIDPEVTTKQVLNLVVVLGAVHTSLDTTKEAVVLVERVGDICHEVVVNLVGVTLLDDVVRAMTISVWRCRTILVGVDHTIEVHTTVPICTGIRRTLQVREYLVI